MALSLEIKIPTGWQGNFINHIFFRAVYQFITAAVQIYGEHSQPVVITDNIIRDCQVKYILQGGNIKQYYF